MAQRGERAQENYISHQNDIITSISETWKSTYDILMIFYEVTQFNSSIVHKLLMDAHVCGGGPQGWRDSGSTRDEQGQGIQARREAECERMRKKISPSNLDMFREVLKFKSHLNLNILKRLSSLCGKIQDIQNYIYAEIWHAFIGNTRVLKVHTHEW